MILAIHTPQLKLIGVNLLPQLPLALKCDDLPWCQNHSFSAGRIPASSLTFLFQAEFSETGDQHDTAGFYGLFDKFQQNFDGFNRPFTGESISFCHCVYNVGFCEGAG